MQVDVGRSVVALGASGRRGASTADPTVTRGVTYPVSRAGLPSSAPVSRRSAVPPPWRTRRAEDMSIICNCRMSRRIERRYVGSAIPRHGGWLVLAGLPERHRSWRICAALAGAHLFAHRHARSIYRSLHAPGATAPEQSLPLPSQPVRTPGVSFHRVILALSHQPHPPKAPDPRKDGRGYVTAFNLRFR